MEDLDLENFYQKSKVLELKRSDVFSDEFLPKKIQYRTHELQAIMANILGRHNIYMSGLVSTGKTLCVRKVLQICKKDSNSETLYIYHNCKGSNKMGDVYSEIANALCFKIQRNKPLKYYIDHIRNVLKESKYSRICLILDEIDYILNRYQEDDTLYLFANDSIYRIVLISNTTNWLENLGVRTKDRLQGIILNFHAYTTDELKGILNQRVELGIDNGVISETEVSHIVSVMQDNNGTVREGIEMLSRLYDYKVLNNHNDIILSKEQISYFLNQIREDTKLAFYAHNLTPNLKFAVFCITYLMTNRIDRDYFTIEDLEKYWNKTSKQTNTIDDRSYHTMRNYLKELETYNFVSKSRSKGVGRSSYHFKYVPDFNIKEFRTYFDTEYSMKQKIKNVDNGYRKLERQLDGDNNGEDGEDGENSIKS